MCTILLPPGVNPIAVNKYINIKLAILQWGKTPEHLYVNTKTCHKFLTSASAICTIMAILFLQCLSEEVLLRVKEQRNILLEISKQKANWTGHNLRRNCLLQRVLEGRIKGGVEVTGRRGRRRKKLLDDLTERR
jgi:hypothetical protein